MDGDFVHSHGSEIQVVRSCLFDSALDLVAISGQHSVEVISCHSSDCSVVATFHIGTPGTALAWSPQTCSPYSLQSNETYVELVAAGSDGNLSHLSKEPNNEEQIRNLRCQLTGHSGKINDLTFCGDPRSETGGKYLASVGDDKMVAVWDLYPERPEKLLKKRASSTSFGPEAAPTAWTMLLPHPLHSVVAHPENHKELLVSDCHGSIFLIDWRTDARGNGILACRQQIIAEFMDPKTLSQAYRHVQQPWSGSTSWKLDDINIIGAAFGDRWVLWDQSLGYKPFATGSAFEGGAQKFCWCPNDCNLFALSPLNTRHGATLHIHSTAFMNAPPTKLTIKLQPHIIRDFDWLTTKFKSAPRIAVGIGKLIYIIKIGEAIQDLS